MSDNGHLETSETIDKLAEALAAAQAEFEGAKKDSDNPFFKSRYADLASVWDACRGALTKHGLAVLQAPSAHENEVSVTTLLMHSSGQWARSTLTTLAKDASPQAVGSCVSYLRRYSLQSTVGVAAEDDDGNAAQSDNPQPPARRDAEAEERAIFDTPGEPMSDADAVAAFQKGLKDCPNCKSKGTIIRGKAEFGGGWVCWSRNKSKSCGSKWKDQAQRTPEEQKAQVHRGTLTLDYLKERDELLKECGEISDHLDATEEQRKTWWGTYCEGAHKGNVDLAALTDLVKFLRLKKDQAQAR